MGIPLSQSARSGSHSRFWFRQRYLHGGQGGFPSARGAGGENWLEVTKARRKPAERHHRMVHGGQGGELKNDGASRQFRVNI